MTRASAPHLSRRSGTVGVPEKGTETCSDQCEIPCSGLQGFLFYEARHRRCGVRGAAPTVSTTVLLAVVCTVLSAECRELREIVPQVTPWGTVLLEKLIVDELVVFYETRRSMTQITTAAPVLGYISPFGTFGFILPSTLRLPFRFFDQNFVIISHLSHARYVPR